MYYEKCCATCKHLRILFPDAPLGHRYIFICDLDKDPLDPAGVCGMFSRSIYYQSDLDEYFDDES